MTSEEAKKRTKELNAVDQEEWKNIQQIEKEIADRIEEFKKTQLADIYDRHKKAMDAMHSAHSEIHRIQKEYEESMYPLGCSLNFGADMEAVKKALAIGKVVVNLIPDYKFLAMEQSSYSYIGKLYKHPMFTRNDGGYRIDVNAIIIPFQIKEDGTLVIISKSINARPVFFSSADNIYDIGTHVHGAYYGIGMDFLSDEDFGGENVFDRLYDYLWKYLQGKYMLDSWALENGTVLWHEALCECYDLVKEDGMVYCKARYDNPFLPGDVHLPEGERIIKGFSKYDGQ